MVILGSCAGQRKLTLDPKVTFNSERSLASGEDSIQYELVIMDPGFEPWFETHRKPEWYYSVDYLRQWNIQYVSAWNYNFRNRQFHLNHPDNPFDQEIDYSPRIDYGLTLNWKLYHYFLYIEDTWGKILPYDRRN